jgi:hypothetical protein
LVIFLLQTSRRKKMNSWKRPFASHEDISLWQGRISPQRSLAQFVHKPIHSYSILCQVAYAMQTTPPKRNRNGHKVLSDLTKEVRPLSKPYLASI